MSPKNVRARAPSMDITSKCFIAARLFRYFVYDRCYNVLCRCFQACWDRLSKQNLSVVFSSFLERMLTDQGSFGITSYDTDFAKSSFRSGVENVQRSITLDKTSSQKDLISLVSCWWNPLWRPKSIDSRRLLMHERFLYLGYGIVKVLSWK